ncbi:hypothetical protein RUMHYD_03383 [Blautia hydrogenotrophica DSM 10507]|uniref:Uncharacterized protein n=1 Tax=Blautia hydrogenotrophica (strain DSM 10507 / JCM 14656 / S5a33) TaxID=476272 RepID=C0CR70_BLAHS|nr:hypothetical protein RUMHYD_03383 [Blautia hydrogenotrophica DSM 10507]
MRRVQLYQSVSVLGKNYHNKIFPRTERETASAEVFADAVSLIGLYGEFVFNLT